MQPPPILTYYPPTHTTLYNAPMVMKSFPDLKTETLALYRRVKHPLLLHLFIRVQLSLLLFLLLQVSYSIFQAMYTIRDHSVDRDVWIYNVVKVRNRILANKDERHQPKIQEYLISGWQELESKKHPIPYIPPENPDGSFWERNIPPAMYQDEIVNWWKTTEKLDKQADSKPDPFGLI